eukprot:Em0010g539a
MAAFITVNRRNDQSGNDDEPNQPIISTTAAAEENDVRDSDFTHSSENESEEEQTVNKAAASSVEDDRPEQAAVVTAATEEDDPVLKYKDVGYINFSATGQASIGQLLKEAMYISPINLLKASLVYVRGDRCLKDYGFRLSQAVDSAERFDSNWSKTKTTTAPTSPSLERNRYPETGCNGAPSLSIKTDFHVNFTETFSDGIRVFMNGFGGETVVYRWMLSQPILAPKYNVHQRSKEHDMVSVSLSAFVLLYSNFQVQRLAWNLWIRINLLIRYILMIRHECCE